MSNKQKEYLQQVTDRLIKQIENNTASWQRPFEAGNYAGTTVPVNIKGKPYNGMNMLSLMSIAEEKGYTDNRWLTFNGAKELGAKVKKGEVASDIYYWKYVDTVTVNKKDKQGNDVLDEKGNNVKEKINIKLSKPQVFFAKVFNAEQLEGMPPIDHTKNKLEEWERHDIAERILKASGVEIIHKPSETPYYSPTQDHIVLPERGQFKTADNYYATALHELGHATGHESRLNRGLWGVFGSETYAKEELRAEIASMMIGQELQIGHDPSQHIAYLESWVKAIKDNPKEIFQAVRDADAIQDYILSLDPQRTKEIDESRQDQSVIKLLEENHDSIKAENKDLTTPLETYRNIEQFINSFEAIKYNVVANRTEGGFSLNYFEAGRKTEITTDIGGMDGKALTSYKGERIEGSRYSSDHLQQQTDLITALDHDITEQKQLVQEAKAQIENLKIFLNVPFNEKEEAKALGAKWDKLNKSWFTFSQDQDKFSKWLQDPAATTEKAVQEPKNNIDQKAERTYLYVTPQEKDVVKQLGGRYDKDLQVWYTTNKDTSKFDQWISRPSVPTPEEEFTKFLKERNVHVEAGHPIMNGKAQRLSNEQSDAKNVMYQVYMNHGGGVPSGRVTNFSRDGVPEKWTYPIEYVQKEQMIELVDRAKFGANYQPEKMPGITENQENKNEQLQPLEDQVKTIDKVLVYDQTAARVQELFKICPLADLSEPYLDRKGVTGNELLRVIPHSSALPPELAKDIAIADNWRQAKAMRENNPENKMIVQAGSLIVPQYNKQGELRSFETIGHQGAKYALKDGEKDGLSLQLGSIENGKPFAITEGYADGATLHEHAQTNRLPTVVAFGKGGLLAVALDYRERYPESKIYLGADNDHENELKPNIEVNAGIKNAVEAAKAVNGYALIPEFNRTDKGKDWSDIYIDSGINALRDQLTNSLANKSQSYISHGNKTALQFGEVENGKPFLIANNYLVAKTLNEQTKQPVILVFEKSDKLIDSVQEFRDKYPESRIYFTSEKHQDAANSIKGYVLNPNQQGKDWHDLYVDKGTDGLKNQLKDQLNKITLAEVGKVQVDFSSLKLEQQKPIRNFVIGLEEKLKDNPLKLNQALSMVQEKIPEIASGKIKIAEALNIFKENKSQEKDVTR